MEAEPSPPPLSLSGDEVLAKLKTLVQLHAIQLQAALSAKHGKAKMPGTWCGLWSHEYAAQAALNDVSFALRDMPDANDLLALANPNIVAPEKEYKIPVVEASPVPQGPGIIGASVHSAMVDQSMVDVAATLPPVPLPALPSIPDQAIADPAGTSGTDGLATAETSVDSMSKASAPPPPAAPEPPKSPPKPKEKPILVDDPEVQARSLVVHGIPKGISEGLLLIQLSSFGAIEKMSMGEDDDFDVCYAVVTYESPDASVAAIKQIKEDQPFGSEGVLVMPAKLGLPVKGLVPGVAKSERSRSRSPRREM